MKLLRFIVISLFATLATSEGEACWGGWSCPEEYTTYRIRELPTKPSESLKGATQQTLRNCEEWRKMTGGTVPLKDIYEAVYKMELKEVENATHRPKTSCQNAFINWMTKSDTAVLNFLILAKTNEFIRMKVGSRWYYPTMETGAQMTLEEVVEKALGARDKRLRDRYLLQAVRALFSMGKYERCIALWEKELCHLPEDNLMRRLVLPYIAGAEFHISHTDKALAYFAEIGDAQSMLYCMGQLNETFSKLKTLELICEYAPNSIVIEELLEECIGEKGLYELSLKIARSGKSQNPAMWYYTAAFLADKEGDLNEAHHLLKKGERSKGTEVVKQSIKIFRIYLDAKRLPYNATYERHLMGQLKWLDAMIANNIDERVHKVTTEGWRLKEFLSYYYWNDMMRKIVLGEVCPRMLKAGMTTRALQFANMADNRLLGLVDRHNVSFYNDPKDVTLTMSAFRYSGYHNHFDYSNHFFEMIDSLGVNAAVNYVQRVEQPKDAFDRVLNQRGYVESDYLNDIIGTQYLRQLRYREALIYLGKVSTKGNAHINTQMTYDPFSITPKSTKPNLNFKYDFAREMYALEQGIALTTEPNRKAQLMIKYATGIRNSFDYCWELTQYYRGTSYWAQVCEKRDWETGKHATFAKKKVEELLTQATQMITDDEVGAEIQYAFHNYKTVAEKYPNTKKGTLVRGACDNLYDHHAEARWERKMEYSWDW